MENYSDSQDHRPYLDSALSHSRQTLQKNLILIVILAITASTTRCIHMTVQDGHFLCTGKKPTRLSARVKTKLSVLIKVEAPLCCPDCCLNMMKKLK